MLMPAFHVQVIASASRLSGRETRLRRALKSWMHGGVATVLGKLTYPTGAYDGSEPNAKSSESRAMFSSSLPRR